MANPTSESSSGAPQAPSPFYMDDLHSDNNNNKWTKFSKKEGSASFSRRSLLSNKNNTNKSNKSSSWCGKCAKLVKEQRARFYIIRRCVVMLICWRHYSD